MSNLYHDTCASAAIDSAISDGNMTSSILVPDITDISVIPIQHFHDPQVAPSRMVLNASFVATALASHLPSHCDNEP